MTRSADALELRHTREEEWNGGQTTSRGNHHFIGTPPPRIHHWQWRFGIWDVRTHRLPSTVIAIEV
jgi:hypothetical protein